MVTIEFAASCMPLMKSKISAIAISAIRTGNASETSKPVPSDVFDHGRMDHIANIVETVDDLFKVIVHLVAGDITHRIGQPVALIQLTQSLVMKFVGLAFQPRNLF